MPAPRSSVAPPATRLRCYIRRQRCYCLNSRTHVWHPILCFRLCVCARAHTHMHTQHTHTHTQNNKQGKWEEVAIPTASISVLYYVFSTGDRGSVIVDLTVLAAASCHRINAHSPSHRHHHFPIPTPTRIHHHQTTFHGGHHTAIAAIPRVASQVDRLSLPSASASPPAPLPASEVSSG